MENLIKIVLAIGLSLGGIATSHQLETKSKSEAQVIETVQIVNPEPTVVPTPEPTQEPTVAPVATPKPVVKPVTKSAAPVVVQSSIQEIIVKWANHYGVDAQTLLRVAKCESNFNPTIVNMNYSARGTHPSGLFQHIAAYWDARAAKYGVPGASIWDVEAQARVTAAMFADGQSGYWECR